MNEAAPGREETRLPFRRRLERLRALTPFDAAALYTLKERENFKNDLWDRMDAAYQEMRA